MWLPDGDSLYDRLGNGMSLLRLRNDTDAGSLVEAAAANGMPLDVLDLRDERLEDRYGGPLILVRPDQHMAWRGSTVDLRTAGKIINRVCGV